ncbi:MAG: hypothetical protein P1V35_08780, partial [Planctomycetota bacterium]|nr:hypothetical protein [Planctomycetota bacterium]
MNPFSKQKASERYRVRAESNELEMLLDTEGGSLPTEITGLSMDGVGFFLAKDTSEAMQIGESVRMTFYDMHTGLKVHVVGVITEWTEEQNTYLVDVEFTNQSSMGEQLGKSETWRHFNRRQHFRIHPRMSHYRRSTVTLQWRAHEGAHILHDVSAGGLSIRLASQDKLEVPRDRPIKAFLNLPHSGEVLEFTLKFV